MRSENHYVGYSDGVGLLKYLLNHRNRPYGEELGVANQRKREKEKSTTEIRLIQDSQVNPMNFFFLIMILFRASSAPVTGLAGEPSRNNSYITDGSFSNIRLVFFFKICGPLTHFRNALPKNKLKQPVIAGLNP